MGKSDIRQLSEDFLYTFYHAALDKDYICGILIENMKQDYLPDKQFQLITRVMSIYYREHKAAPSYAYLMEKVREDLDAVELVQTIQEFASKEKESVLIETFEEYIKDVKLKQLYAEIPKYYNKGEAEKAQQAIKKYAEWLNVFSLNASKFVDVFGTFTERHADNAERALKHGSEKKPVYRFYVDDLDDLNGGRNLRGQVTCFLASTGVGKSHAARHIGTHASIDDGLNVLHIQLEGSEDEVVNAYSGAIVEQSSYRFEKGLFTEKEIEQFSKKLDEVRGNIDVRSFPRFNCKVSTVDVKNAIEEYKKIYGYAPDVLIIDSMDLLNDSSGRNWDSEHERSKRIAVANDLKDLASDEDIWVVVTYQATIENREWLNDPKNVLTEYNCSEAKGLARPMTHLISLNQTDDERNDNLMRLHVAKSRFFRKGATIRIATDYENEVFYDRRRTLNLVA